MQRVRDFGALGPKWDVFSEPFPSRIRGDGSLQGNSLSAGLMDIWAQRDNKQHEQEDPHKLKPDGSRSYLQLISTDKGKTGFLQWSSTGYINHILGQASFQEVVGEHKMNWVVFLHFIFSLILLCFLCVGVFVCLVGCLVFLILLVLFILIFCMFLFCLF